MAIGAAVSVAALLFAFVAMPVARRWSEREDAIRLSRERVARLRGLTERQSAVIAAARARDEAMNALPQRILRGRTAGLAASELQRVLQDYAIASRVSISRLDVAGETKGDSTASGNLVLPAALAAVTDIYGLADLLERMKRGSTLLDVSELNVTSNAVLRGELLQVSMTVRAPYMVAP